ncbi:MAG: flavin monoamine oxidase family protein [Bacteroidia bacterium]|jgi:monoamine oxidase
MSKQPSNVTDLNRRKLITTLAVAWPAAFISTGFLASCKPDDLPEPSFTGKVCIVGAGAAGIYAAAYLQKRGIEVVLIEASSRAGGRMMSDTSFCDFPLEMGAEFMHGARSVLYDLALNLNPSSISEVLGNPYYFFNQALRNEEYFLTSSALQGSGQTLLQIYDSLSNYTGADLTLEQYLLQFPINQNLMEVANALIANDYGSSLDRIGMYALREAEQGYASGTTLFNLRDKSLISLFEAAFPKVFSAIEFNTVLQGVEINSDGVVLQCSGDKVIQADRVILTVPITMLQNNSISFTPELPADKIDAIQSIRMDAGVKVFLKCSNAFWASDMASILGGSVIPEYWISSAGKNTNQYILTGFVTGPKAEWLSALSDSEVRQNIVQELQLMFPQNDISALVNDILIKRWLDEPFIRGAYSYPSSESTGKRKILARNEWGKLFFAGEACNSNGHQGTVHGAMESAITACLELMQS